MSVVQAKNDTFQKEVIEHKGIVLVDFYADWCGPCKMVGPIIEDLSNKMKDVRFVKVNVDQDTDVAGKYSVFSIPTFIIFKDGAVIEQFVGAQGQEVFIEKLRKAGAK